MHVIIATDGSRQSIQAARYMRATINPDTVTSVGVLAVTSPLAAVPFATESDAGRKGIDELSFKTAATKATTEVAEIFAGWGPKVTKQVRSGGAAAEIVKAAKAKNAGLIVLASSSSRAGAVLMGSVAHRVLNLATCPVLVWRPGMKGAPRKKA